MSGAPLGHAPEGPGHEPLHLTYPDLTVVCGPPELEDDRRDTLLNPALIIEVLSESTERHDRGKKFEQYRKLPSLREYLLVSQDQVLVEQYTREEDGRWSFREHRAGTQVHLPSLRCELSVDTVAARVFGG